MLLATVATAAAQHLVPGRFGQSLQGSGEASWHVEVAAKDVYTALPVTVESWVKLNSATGYNLFVAAELKESSDHWEIYSEVDTGRLACYLPGKDPTGVITDVNIVDGQWHYVAIVFDTGGAPQNPDGSITGTVTRYFDGTIPVGSTSNVTKDNFGDSLNRGIGLGMHPLGFDLDFFDGLTFEPRVSLGALSPSALLFSVGPLFRRGDTNDDGAIDISDAIYVLNALFVQGTEPLPCLDAADASDDGVVDLADGIFLLNALFTGGGPIPPPSPGCGLDPTADDPQPPVNGDLGCGSYTACP